MRFNRLQRLVSILILEEFLFCFIKRRAFLLCQVENHTDDHIYSTYDETLNNDLVLSRDTTSSHSTTSLSNQSWMSSQSNVYDQIDYESIHTNTDNNSPPYTPNSQMNDINEDYCFRLPTRSCEILSQKPSFITFDQTNSKKELHKELIHRQKMGQLLPKKPELLNVFQQRRTEEKKRAAEQMHEQTKLEQILARQRQKLDQSNTICSISSNKSTGSNEFEFVYRRICQTNKTKE